MPKTIEVEVEFTIEDVVYVKTDEKQLPRIVKAYLVGKQGVSYHVALNESSSYFKGFELSSDKNLIRTSTKVGFNNR